VEIVLYKSHNHCLDTYILPSRLVFLSDYLISLLHQVLLFLLQGNLALSRALGDFCFKKNDKKPPEEQIVTGTSIDVTAQSHFPVKGKVHYFYFIFVQLSLMLYRKISLQITSL